MTDLTKRGGDVGPLLRPLLTRVERGFDPFLKTRPRRAGNLVPPAARFEPLVRQTLGGQIPERTMRTVLRVIDPPRFNLLSGIMQRDEHLRV